MPDKKYFRKTARFNGKKLEATGKTELEAMTKLAEKLAAAKRGEETIGAGMTVDAWFREWYDLYKDPKDMTDKSKSMYQMMYSKHIRPRIGSMKLRDVRDVHLQKILNDQRGKSFSHVAKLRMVMTGLFSKARRSRLIPFDPSEGLEIPATTEKERRSITEEERAAILEVAKTHRAGLWVLTLLYTGMRPGETATLTWSDVDFKRNEIHVHTAKESGSRNIKAPKTCAGIRDIPIHADLLPLLLKARGDPFDYVFTTRTGNRHDDKSIGRMWASFKKAVDIQMGADVLHGAIVRSVVAEDLVPYCLRHTFCTDLKRSGVPLEVAKDLMGHEDIRITANIYMDKDNGLLHDAIAALDGTLGRNGGGKGGGNVKEA